MSSLKTSLKSFAMIEALSVLKSISTEPYPGLRPFQANESHLFFGRDAQVEKLLEKIQNSHFVAVIGPSGCGKSSLVKAGLIPDLKKGFLIEEGCKCRTIDMHPGDKPFDNLAKALNKSYDDNTQIGCIKAELKRGPKGLIEAIKSERVAKKEIILLVVDQFEELFRYKQNNNIDEVIAFIALLIESANQQEIPIHIVITMRSDFLGECSLFPGLPEILNDNQFLTPRLTREQLKEAIEAPALVCGGKLDPLLVNTLLNDVGIDHDQLPLLQHALMRMWTLAKEKTPKRETLPDLPLEELKSTIKYKIVLTLEDYATIGKLNRALTQHASQAYDKLTKKQQTIAEIIFRRLSERNAEQKDVRRPSSVHEIAAVANVTDAEVIEVAKVFIDPEYNFLTSSDDQLTGNSYLDISHESIIRQWDKMREWITREYEAATRYKRLIADAKDYQAKTKEVLAGISLQNALLFRERNNINEAWALRYSNKEEYKLAEDYINESKDEEERTFRASEKRKLKKRAWGYSLTTAFAALILAIGIISFKSRIASAKAKNDALEANLKYARSTAEIEVQKARADEEEKDKIISQQNEARIAKKNEEIEKQKRELEKRKTELEIKTKALETATADLTAKNKKLTEEKIIRDIQDLDFVSKLDPADRALAIRTLLPMYMRDSTSANLDSLKNDFADLVYIRENFQKTNAGESFRLLKDIWQNNKTALANSLITKIANENLFYKQRLIPETNYGLSFYLMDLSNNYQNFALSCEFADFTGRYINDSLIADPDQNQTSYEDSVNNRTVSIDHPLLSSQYENGRLLRLEGNGNIVETKPGGNKVIGKMPIDRNQQYKISPSGEYVISAPKIDSIDITSISKDRNIKLWKLRQHDKNTNLNYEILTTSSNGVKTIEFSSDGNKVLLLSNKSKLEVWTIGMKNVKLYETQRIAAANFTTDGKNLITISTSGLARLLDTTGNTKNERNVRLPAYDYQSTYESVIASPDLKRLIVKKNQVFTLYERGQNDSIFKPALDAEQLMSKVLPMSSDIIQASFLNDQSIITADNTGYIYLWKNYPKFNNATAAFATIQTPFQNENFNDPAYLKSLLASSDVAKLNSIAKSLESSSEDISKPEDYIKYIDIAKKIYARLTQLTHGNTKTEYENRVISLNTALIDEETSLQDNLNYKLAVKLVPRLKENIAIKENRLDLNDSLAVISLSNDYWNLSWYQLFKGDFAETISSVDRGLKLYPANDGILTNKASGLLLSRKFAEAEALYMKYKGRKYTNQERDFTTSFLQDFDDLTEAGVIKQSDKELYDHVLKIKGLLSK